VALRPVIVAVTKGARLGTPKGGSLVQIRRWVCVRANRVLAVSLIKTILFSSVVVAQLNSFSHCCRRYIQR